jgi:DNA-binding transcriptional LysR family regulator
MELEIRHLRYFLAVADCESMTRAAERLGIQQPPLSVQIQALEKHLGLALFHRRSRGMELTEGGKMLAIEARRMLDDIAQMQQRMARFASGEQGSLRVGFTSSAAAHAFTPAALRFVRTQYPGIHIELSEDNAASLIESIVDSRLHCGLLRVPVSQPEGLVFETLLREHVVVALPRDHPLAKDRLNKKKTLALKDLRDEAFILVRRPGSAGLYANFLSLCERQGFQPRIASEVPRMLTNLNLVAAGAGISIVPASMQGVHSEAIVYIPLKEVDQMDAPLTLAWRKEDTSGPSESFVKTLKTFARTYIPS